MIPPLIRHIVIVLRHFEWVQLLVTFNVTTQIVAHVATHPILVYFINIANVPFHLPTLGWAIWCCRHITGQVGLYYFNITLTIGILVTVVFALEYIYVPTMTPFVEFIKCGVMWEFLWYAASTDHACNLVITVWKIRRFIFCLSYLYIVKWMLQKQFYQYKWSYNYLPL